MEAYQFVSQLNPMKDIMIVHALVRLVLSILRSFLLSFTTQDRNAKTTH